MSATPPELDVKPRLAAGRRVTDWGGLQEAMVGSIARPETEAELQAVVRYAVKSGLKLSLRGSGHSSGGQSFGEGVLMVDMRGLDRILSVDAPGRTIRVQSGATWRSLTGTLEPLRLCITTKQEFDNFTVGGSIAANMHGKSIDHGPIIGGVRALRVLKADGEIVTASRGENPEFFRAVVGGHGLLGIVVDATLDLIDDRPVENSERVFMDAPSLVAAYIERVGRDRVNTPLCYGFFDSELRRGFYVAYTYVREDRTYSLDELRRHDPPTALFNTFVYLQRRSSLARRGALRATWIATGRRERTLRSRRLLLWDDPPAGFEGVLLQKYIVPVGRFASFVRRTGEVLRRRRDEIALLTPHFRFVPGSREAMLPLCPEESICLILSHLSRRGDPQWRRAFEHSTADVLDACLDEGGRHYLTFDSVASRDQLLRGYPQWDEFVALKRSLDPGELFTSSFYKRYAR